MVDNESNETQEPQAKPRVSRRQKRKEIGGNRISWAERNTLKTKNRDPNYVYRVVNTDDEKYSGRIEELQERGYIICNGNEQIGDDKGVEANQVGSTVGKPVGRGVRGVLMKIKKEYYEEDQAAKQAEVDQVEMAMVPEELKNSDQMYGEGLKVEDGRGTRMEVKFRK